MRIIALLLTLFCLPAFAQVSYDSGTCTTEASGQTVAWPCSVVQAPPPTQPPADPAIIVIGDSWSENTSGSCSTGGFDMWTVELASREGVDLRNYARCGAPSGEMLAQARSAIDAGFNSGDLITYWLLPNDFSGPGDDIPAIMEQIGANAEQALRELQQAGAQNILVMTLPDGDLIPLFVQSEPFTGIDPVEFTDAINQELIDAAAAVGLSVHDMRPFFRNLDAYGRLTWLSDGKHYSATSNYWIAQYIESLDRI